MTPVRPKESVAALGTGGLGFATQWGLNMGCGWEFLGKTIQDNLQSVAYCRGFESVTEFGGVGWDMGEHENRGKSPLTGN